MTLKAYNGISIPSFMYGTAWKKEATTQLVQLAVASGFTAIDTANQLIHYQEALVGEALMALAAQGFKRDSLFLQTTLTARITGRPMMPKPISRLRSVNHS
jgi:diketogulonate reductase-like aldo/keto reductase